MNLCCINFKTEFTRYSDYTHGRCMVCFHCSSDALSSSSVESLAHDSDSVDGDLRQVEHVHEPEAWSVTMDKSTLRTMSARDIKRQDHIWGNSLSLSLCLSFHRSVSITAG